MTKRKKYVVGVFGFLFLMPLLGQAKGFEWEGLPEELLLKILDLAPRNTASLAQTNRYLHHKATQRTYYYQTVRALNRIQGWIDIRLKDRQLAPIDKMKVLNHLFQMTQISLQDCQELRLKLAEKSERAEMIQRIIMDFRILVLERAVELMDVHPELISSLFASLSQIGPVQNGLAKKIYSLTPKFSTWTSSGSYHENGLMIHNRNKTASLLEIVAISVRDDKDFAKQLIEGLSSYQLNVLQECEILKKLAQHGRAGVLSFLLFEIKNQNESHSLFTWRLRAILAGLVKNPAVLSDLTSRRQLLELLNTYLPAGVLGEYVSATLIGSGGSCFTLPEIWIDFGIGAQDDPHIQKEVLLVLQSIPDSSLRNQSLLKLQTLLLHKGNPPKPIDLKADDLPPEELLLKKQESQKELEEKLQKSYAYEDLELELGDFIADRIDLTYGDAQLLKLLLQLISKFESRTYQAHWITAIVQSRWMNPEFWDELRQYVAALRDQDSDIEVLKANFRMSAVLEAWKH